MKKLAVGILFSAITVMAQAAEEIKIVWGFSIGSNQANTVRILIDEANKIQDKYKFVLENKTGAGGSIAANYVLQNGDNSMVAMSSSFFIRPAFVKEGSHDLDQFRAVFVQATGAPLGLVSGKYKTIVELEKLPTANIAIAGPGSISDIMATAMSADMPNIKRIPFKSMVDGTVAAAGGHVDAAITFVVDAEQFINKGEIYLLGKSGTIKGTENITANYGMFASKSMSRQRAREIHSIFAKVNETDTARASYRKDLLTPVALNFEDSQQWFAKERKLWAELVSKLK
jgi:tripartite-type tricarboxylate transporter receptor subunit TctC